MGGPGQRLIFLFGFLAACAAFWLGYRRIRRVPAARTTWEALRLAFRLSLALLVAGCPATTTGSGGTTPTATTTTPTTTPTPAEGTGLGEAADAVWAELVALWDEAGTFVTGEVTSETLDAARGRADGLLARLGGIDRVASDAPGLVALLRIEFLARLERMPANVLCYEPAAARMPEAEAYERLAARVEALEELAGKGYVNGWLQEHVLSQLRNDLAAVREATAQGDDWRTEDDNLRQVDPTEVQALVERLETALQRLAGP